MKNTIVIIDGNSLINRAYYAMQRPMITKEGIYTQGIYGFVNMLKKVEDDYQPTHIVCCFDRKEPTFRHLEYKDYKAGRKPMPIELQMEMPILKDVLHAMNISTFELAGYEADDLIGTISKRAETDGLSPLIVTGDRDALQLASDITKVLITKRGVTDFVIYDRSKMIEEYGLTPEQFIDLKGIMGDTSDNIPGIPGIGEKGGIELLAKFGSIENMLAHIDEIEKTGLRNKVSENVELCKKSKWLATIDRNVPMDFTFDDLKFEEPDYEKLINLYTKLEFRSFLSRLKINPEKAGNTNFEPAVNIDIKDSTLIKEISDLKKISVLKGRETFIKIFSDYSHTGKPEVTGIVLSTTEDAFYISEALFLTGEDAKTCFEAIAKLKLRLVGHDIKNDLYVMMSYGLKDFDIAFDTSISEYVLDVSKTKYDLQQIALERAHFALPGIEDFVGNGQIDMFGDNSQKYLDYGILLAKAVFGVMAVQKAQIKEKGLEEVLYSVELPLIEVLANMEISGINIEIGVLDELGKEFKTKISELEDKIYELTGEKFNIKSPKQLGEVLFEHLGLKSGKKTKSGYSTAQEVLEKIQDEHPVIPYILEYRNLTKLDSTYVEGLKPLSGKDGKIHAHFMQNVTQTGRISCVEPNLQNIPVRQELGRKLRKAFCADEGYTLVGADYSQIELRVLAHLSGDEGLIQAFNKGEDIHKITASKVLGIPLEKVSKEDRSRAKAVNFGVIYGMSAFGLSSELNISRKDADEYINEYFRTHPRVKSYMDEQKESAKNIGYSLTILGRKREIPELKSSNFMIRQLGERLAMNTPIQGSAADIIKLAMIRVYKKLNENYPDSKLVLQVHDELIINAKNEDLAAISKLLKDEMEQAMKLKVRLEVDMNQAFNWYDLK